VLLGDDHNVLSDGLQRLIATNYEVVRALSDGRELVAAAQEKKPRRDYCRSLLNSLIIAHVLTGDVQELVIEVYELGPVVRINEQKQRLR
jgi:hypothetical protein